MCLSRFVVLSIKRLETRVEHERRDRVHQVHFEQLDG